jgi:hypothetical protein
MNISPIRDARVARANRVSLMGAIDWRGAMRVGGTSI